MTHYRAIGASAIWGATKMEAAEREQLLAKSAAARHAARAAMIQLAICSALLVVGVILGARGAIVGGIVFFVGVFGSRIASRDLRRHRLAIRAIEEQLAALPALEDEDDQ